LTNSSTTSQRLEGEAWKLKRKDGAIAWSLQSMCMKESMTS
jgi:hypothetical protein